MHLSKIKAKVKKENPTLKIEQIKKYKFGIFIVKVSKETPKSKKIGTIFGEDKGDNIILDKVTFS